MLAARRAIQPSIQAAASFLARRVTTISRRTDSPIHILSLRTSVSQSNTIRMLHSSTALRKRPRGTEQSVGIGSYDGPKQKIPKKIRSRLHHFVIPYSPKMPQAKPVLVLTDAEEKVRRVLVDVAADLDKRAVSLGKAVVEPLTLRFTGGWVRDKILGQKSNDLDVGISRMTGYEFASAMTEYITQNSEKYGIESRSIHKIESNPEKSKHLETATTKIMDLDIDFVNLRSETYSEDSRIPQMEFGTPEEDAVRRDATINALFYNIHTQEVEDFTERGLADMEERLIRTPLAPYETFKDDPLRVLRLIRFASRLGFVIVDEVSEAMKNEEIKAALRTKISRERVGTEVEKMLTGAHPRAALSLFHDIGLYDCIFAPPSEQVSANLPRSRLFEAINVAEPMLTGTSLSSSFSKLIQSDRDRYYGWILAALVPWEGRIFEDKKKSIPAAAAAARDGLKVPNKLFEVVAKSYEHYSEIHHLVEENASSRLSRVKLALKIGVAVRKYGADWHLQVFTSLLLDQIKAQDTGKQSMVIEAYDELIKTIYEYNLEEAWNFKPLLNGKDLCMLFGKKSGPWMKNALEDVMEWQLANPEGSKEEAVEFARGSAEK